MAKSPLLLKSVGSEALPELVLVHGWGHSSSVWAPLLELLEGCFRIHLLDLPGYGGAKVCDEHNAVQQAWQLETLLDAFLQLPIGSAIWCGWSLGGMLAAYHAACHPTRVRGVLTIASNVCFVQRSDWSTAMPQLDYAHFQESVHTDTSTTLARFLGLVAQGSDTARHDLRALKAAVGKMPAGQPTLSASLALLSALDTRPALAALAMPQCHLLGEHDALVPVAAAPAMALLNGAADIRTVAGAGHAVWLSHPQSVVKALSDLEACL